MRISPRVSPSSALSSSARTSSHLWAGLASLSFGRGTNWPCRNRTVTAPPSSSISGTGRPALLARSRHLQRPASPLLDNAASVEGAGDQRVPRPWHSCGAGQLLRRQAEVQGAGGRDLQTVVVDRYANRAAANGVVAVA